MCTERIKRTADHLVGVVKDLFGNGISGWCGDALMASGLYYFLKFMLYSPEDMLSFLFFE